MINIIHLKQKDKSRILLDDINLTVPENTIFGILCEEKAERAALAESLSGVSSITEGKILICDRSITTDRLGAQILIGYMPEAMSFYKNMTVIEFLSFITEIRQLDFQTSEKNIKEALTSTGLIAVKDALICNLSPAGKARLGIAQAIVSNPSVLIFNNPTCDLNKNETQEIFKLIKSLCKAKSVIILSDNAQVFSFCDDGAIISLGKLDTNIQSFLGKGAK